MNLIGEPWIPVIFQDKQSGLVSLKDAFSKGREIRDIIANPPQRIALMRLLLCVAHAALDGPKDNKERAACKLQLVPKVESYLSKHHQAFELYGERAFLQVPNLTTTDNAVVDKLDFGLAAGNNATLFDHEAGPAGRDLPAPNRALSLLAYQCFSSGGTIGVTRWGGQSTDSKKDKGPGTSEHAPCLDGTPLHLFIRSNNLLETIFLNLLTKEMIESMPNIRWGKPVWEEMPSSPSDPVIEEIANSYLGRLVPLSRAIKMASNSTNITLANGVTYPKFPEFREPCATVIRRGQKQGQNEQGYLGINLSKHVWRELGSILSASNSRTQGKAFALSFIGSSDFERDGEGFDIWTGGLVADKGKVIDVAEWNVFLSFSMMGDLALRKYEKGVELANNGSRLLAGAIVGYFDDLSVSEFKRNEHGKYKRSDPRSREHRNNVISKATGWYWGRLDHQYHVLMKTAAEPEKRLSDDWYPIIWRELQAAYSRACPHETPRQIEAYAKGKTGLWLRPPEE